MLIASDAQLSTVSKRFRNGREQAEFGRMSSRDEGQRKLMLRQSVTISPDETIPLSATDGSMSMEMEEFDIEASMPMNDMSMIITEEVAVEEDVVEEEEEVAEKEEEEVAVEEVDIGFTPVPVPERIGCNGDEYCPIDMQCQCWLFCRFCFFPPCGTCVAN